MAAADSSEPEPLDILTQNVACLPALRTQGEADGAIRDVCRGNRQTCAVVSYGCD